MKYLKYTNPRFVFDLFKVLNQYKNTLLPRFFLFFRYVGTQMFKNILSYKKYSRFDYCVIKPLSCYSNQSYNLNILHIIKLHFVHLLFALIWINICFKIVLSNFRFRPYLFNLNIIDTYSYKITHLLDMYNIGTWVLVIKYTMLK